MFRYTAAVQWRIFVVNDPCRPICVVMVMVVVLMFSHHLVSLKSSLQSLDRLDRKRLYWTKTNT